MSISRPYPYATDSGPEQSKKMTVDAIIAISSSSRTVKAGLKSFNNLFRKSRDMKEMLNISDNEIKTLTETIEIMNKIDTTVNSLIDVAID